MLAKIALDTPVGKRAQLGTDVERLNVPEVVTHDTQHLFHVAEAIMLHDHFVYFWRRFVFDGNAVVTAAFEGTDNSFA